MTTFAAALPAGYRLLHLPECGSTNTEALARAEAGEAGGLWILADRQTAGRGRSGRRWVSEEGNLFASLLLQPGCTPETASKLAFLAALSLADTVKGLDKRTDGTRPRLSLKWPNDILLDGAKLGGILLESLQLPQTNRLCLVIGVGLNLASHPHIADVNATSLADKGIDAERPVVFQKLAERFDHWLKIWADGTNFAPIREAWLKRAHGLSQPVEASIAGRSINGIFSGLDENGALIVEQADGERARISSGEVFFPQTTKEESSA